MDVYAQYLQFKDAWHDCVAIYILLGIVFKKHISVRHYLLSYIQPFYSVNVHGDKDGKQDYRTPLTEEYNAQTMPYNINHKEFF